jgi:diguanylate cyclase (GGDEF)-like protein
MLIEEFPPRAAELLADFGSDLISHHDSMGFYLGVTPNSERLFGWTPAELEAVDIYEMCHPEDIAQVRGNFADPNPSIIEFRFRVKGGAYAQVRMRSVVGPHGKTTCLIKDVTEIRQLIEANGKLAAQARTDALTGIDNYLGFQDRLQLVLAEAQRGRQFSFLLGDIDHFKVFNDTYGHQAGDKVLRMVAQSMKRVVRAVDFVARYGGEEFVLLLPDTDKEGASILANRIREKVSRMKHDYGHPITMCFGICTYAHRQDSDGILGCADKHLYEAKNMGRNRVEVCSFRPRPESCSG